MMVLEAAVGFMLALLVAVALFEFGARRIYSYALTPAHFEVRLLGRFPIYRVDRNTITSVCDWHCTLADAGAMFTTLRLGNRIFGRAIVIERRAGFPRRLIVTPDDPAAVCSAIRSPSAAANDR